MEIVLEFFLSSNVLKSLLSQAHWCRVKFALEEGGMFETKREQC